jgi:hypothetical protein
VLPQALRPRAEPRLVKAWNISDRCILAWGIENMFWA